MSVRLIGALAGAVFFASPAIVLADEYYSDAETAGQQLKRRSLVVGRLVSDIREQRDLLRRAMMAQAIIACWPLRLFHLDALASLKNSRP